MLPSLSAFSNSSSQFPSISLAHQNLLGIFFPPLQVHDLLFRAGLLHEHQRWLLHCLSSPDSRGCFPLLHHRDGESGVDILWSGCCASAGDGVRVQEVFVEDSVGELLCACFIAIFIVLLWPGCSASTGDGKSVQEVFVEDSVGELSCVCVCVCVCGIAIHIVLLWPGCSASTGDGVRVQEEFVEDSVGEFTVTCLCACLCQEVFVKDSIGEFQCMYV